MRRKDYSTARLGEGVTMGGTSQSPSTGICFEYLVIYPYFINLSIDKHTNDPKMSLIEQAFLGLRGSRLATSVGSIRDEFGPGSAEKADIDGKRRRESN